MKKKQLKENPKANMYSQSVSALKKLHNFPRVLFSSFIQKVNKNSIIELV